MLRPATRSPSAGAHALFLERCAVFESVKVDAIGKALSHREWQVAAANNLYEYAKYAAEAVCEVRCRRRPDTNMQLLLSGHCVERVA